MADGHPLRSAPWWPPGLRTFLFAPPVLPYYGMILLFVVWALDLWQSASRYLYLTTEIGLALATLSAYLSVFAGRRWSDPPERVDAVPVAGWYAGALTFFIYLFGLTAVTLGIWYVYGLLGAESMRAWLKSGSWTLYYVGIYGVSWLIVRNHLQYLHFRALLVTCLILDVVLTAYESILLAQGQGWYYNRTVIGWILGAPLDNILFIYPAAPAFCIALYTRLSRNRNDLRAFWLLTAAIFPAVLVVELVGIYALDLWSIYPAQNILPWGKTSLEEFLYYMLYQLMSVTFYLYFKKYLRPETPGE